MRVCALGLLTGVAVGVATAVGGQFALSKTDRDLHRQMLTDIRRDVEQNYYDPKLRGIDLAANVEAVKAKVDAASSTAEAIDAITGLLFDFKDSHTSFYPPPRATRTRYGWSMAAVGEPVLVVGVDPSSDAAKQGLAPGDLVVALNRFQPTRANLWQIAHYYGIVRPQAQQHVVVRKPDGTERALDIRSRTENRPVVQVTDAIEEAFDDIVADTDADCLVAPGIVVWQMTEFRFADAMRPFIAKARKAGSLVLDLRGNSGGLVDGLKGLVAMVFDKDILVQRRLGRKGEVLDTAKPKGTPFLGKLIVLIDSRSASAAEMLARIVQIEKRGTVIGDRSGGKVMTSLLLVHSFGVGNVTRYATSVTVGDVRMSDGGSLEGTGVTPDELLLPTQADLAAFRDPVLARAVVLAGGSMSPEEAGKLFPRRPVRR
jgi:C-terminal processing protease CtpA/Prc